MSYDAGFVLGLRLSTLPSYAENTDFNLWINVRLVLLRRDSAPTKCTKDPLTFKPVGAPFLKEVSNVASEAHTGKVGEPFGLY